MRLGRRRGSEVRDGAVAGEGLVTFCAGLPGALDVAPGEPIWREFKVRGSTFALFQLQRPAARLHLRSDPGTALALRAQYDAVVPSYFFDKRCWSTVSLDGSIDLGHLTKMIKHSYVTALAGALRVVEPP